MAYDLAIDIGNTRTKLGVFHKDELIKDYTIPNEDIAQNYMLLADLDIREIIISTVNDEAEAELKLEQFKFPVLRLSHKTPLPFQLNYQSPETLGKDRIALVAAAHKLFPNQNCLAIDAGTCITYDFLTEKNQYLGGAISPGIQLRLRAMNQFTNKLPLLNWTDQVRPESIGNTTITSMLSGVVNGLLAEIKGFIEDYKRQYPALKIVLTGGDANFFEKELKNGIFADPNLVLIGLHEILKFNRD